MKKSYHFKSAVLIFTLFSCFNYSCQKLETTSTVAPTTTTATASGDLATASGSPRQAIFYASPYGKLTVPSDGAFWGADDANRENDPNLNIESQLGKRVAIHNRHYGWLDTVVNQSERDDAKLVNPTKVITMVSIMGAGSVLGNFPVMSKDLNDPNWDDKPNAKGNKGLDRIIDGEFDWYWNKIATDLYGLKDNNNVRVPVIFRLWQEMNGQHNPYMAVHQGGAGQVGVSTSTPGPGEIKFRNAWIHVWNIFDAKGATINNQWGNVIFVFCPQSYINAGDWRNYWPGDKYVDWAGIDTYRSTFADDVDNALDGKDFYQFFTQGNKGTPFNHTAHKPLLICEGGWQQDVTDSVAGEYYTKDGNGAQTGANALNAYSYINKMRYQIKNLYKDCIGYVTWNCTGPNGTNYVDTSPASLSQYNAWVTDPYWTITR